VEKAELTHVRHDPAHCLAPGLFRSLPKGGRKTQKLDLTYHFGKNESIRFIGFEPLGADDMRFLQGIVAFAGPNGLMLTTQPETETGRQLRLFLEPRFDAIEQDALIVRESLPRLLAEIGLTDGGENIDALKASLLRMSNVTVLVTQGKKQAAFHLMSHAFNGDDGRLWIALNPRIAESVLGRRSFTRICMTEIRGLKTDPARLMHQRLCGWIDPGKSGRVEMDTLCGYVWPEPTNPEAMKKRRQTARRALGELAAVGWTVSEYAHGKWGLKRPKESSKPHAPDAPAPELLPPPAQIADQICC